MPTLTERTLAVTPAAPDPDRLTAEIRALDRQIDQTPDGPERDALCAAFRALNWARSPDAFAPPSE